MGGMKACGLISSGHVRTVMVSVALRDAFLVNLMSAIILHYSWFKRQELKTVGSPLCLVLVLSVPSACYLYSEDGAALRAFATSFMALSTSLLASIALYRLSPYHPLAKHPGPWQCRLSKFWLAYIAWGGKVHEYYHCLHEEYGDIVRIGPNEISIRDVGLVPTTIGFSGMPKGSMWEGRRLLPSKNFDRNNSLTGVRDLRRHAVLRRPWDAAFKPSAVAAYEDMLLVRADKFVEKLKDIAMSAGADAINLASEIDFFSFDFMGDIAFGGVYSLMRDGDPDGIIAGLRRAVFVPSISQHIPWIQNILLAIPGIGKDTRKFGKFGATQGTKRYAMANSAEYKDLFYYMLEDVPADQALRRLVSSACLAIVAGSDTNSSVLSNVIYYLLCHPEYLHRLRAELDATFPPSDGNETINLKVLATLPILNAVINETLRLQPPVPTALQRAPALGSGGKRLNDDIFILEGTNILVPPYAMHRNPRYFFPKPEEYWPDRWISKDREAILNLAAYFPFGTGASQCPAKALAMTELRYLACLLVRTFDIRFEEAYDPQQWLRELQDRFVLVKGQLPIRLALRHV